MQSTSEANFYNIQPNYVSPNVNETNFQDLCNLIFNRDMEGSIKLIDQIKDINAVDANGYSPLHIACCFGNVEIVEYLLSKNANADLKCAKEMTPLQYAFDGDCTISSLYSIYKLLTDRGASPVFSTESAANLFLNLNLINALDVGSNIQGKEEKFNELAGVLLNNHQGINFNACPEDLKGVSLLNLILFLHFNDAASLFKLITSSSKYADIHEKDKKGVSSFDVAALNPNKTLLRAMGWATGNELPKVSRTIIGAFIDRVKELSIDRKDTFKKNTAFSLWVGHHYKISKYVLILYKKCIQNPSLFDIILPNQNSLLFLSVYTNDLEGAKRLMEGGLDPDKTNGNGQTPLSEAIRLKLPDFVRAMLEFKKRNRFTIVSPVAYLHFALEVGEESNCNLLIEFGYNIDCTDKDKKTPLTYLLSHPSLSAEYKERMSYYLLEKGADPNCFNEFENSPLFYCIVHAPSVRLFKNLIMGKKAQSKQYGAIDIFNACVKYKRIDLFNLLYEGFHTSKNITSPLYFVKPLDENRDFIKCLLDSGVDPNAEISKGFTYLLKAIDSFASEEFLDFLVKEGVRIKKGFSYLFFAIERRNEVGFEWLFKSINFFNPELKWEKYGLILNACLEFNSDTDSSADYIKYLLHSCVKNQMHSIVKRCLITEGDLHLKDAQGETPLDIAKRLNDQEMIHLLVEGVRKSKNAILVQKEILDPLSEIFKKKNGLKEISQKISDAFSLELLMTNVSIFEKTISALKEAGIGFNEFIEKKKKRYIVSFDPIPLLSNPALLLKTIEKHLRNREPVVYKPAAIRQPANHGAFPKKKEEEEDRKTAEKDIKDFNDYIIRRQKEEKRRLDQESGQRLEEENFPNALTEKNPWDQLKKELQAKEKKLQEQETSQQLRQKTHKKPNSRPRASAAASTKKNYIGTPRARRGFQKKAPRTLTFADTLPLHVQSCLEAPTLKFIRYYQSASRTLTSIGDLVARFQNEYSVEREIFDRNLGIHALEYRLLRLTQALTATGYDLTKEERVEFSKQIGQAINLSPMIGIRNQLRHEECIRHEEIFNLAKNIANSHLADNLNALISGNPIDPRSMVNLKASATLNSIKWEKKFSNSKSEKEKEYEGSSSSAIENYIFNQFEFLKNLAKPIALDLHTFSLGGDRIDAMKMCLIKMGQCFSLLNPSEKPIKDISQVIKEAGNAISHKIEETIPFCLLDDIPDTFLFEFVKNLDIYQKLLGGSRSN